MSPWLWVQFLRRASGSIELDCRSRGRTLKTKHTRGMMAVGVAAAPEHHPCHLRWRLLAGWFTSVGCASALGGPAVSAERVAVSPVHLYGAASTLPEVHQAGTGTLSMFPPHGASPLLKGSRVIVEVPVITVTPGHGVHHPKPGRASGIIEQ